MKRLLLILVVCVCCVIDPLMSCAEKYDVKFSLDFCKEISNNISDLGNVTCLNDTIYGLIGSDLYRWNSQEDDDPAYFCSLPVNNYWDDSFWIIKKSELNEEQISLLGSRVDQLTAGDGKIWGYNLISGRIGTIDENGISWLPKTIDTSVFFRDEGLISYFSPINSFVIQNQLYIFGDNNQQIEPVTSSKALISFDLETGAYTYYQIHGAVNCSTYKNNHLLLSFPEGQNIALYTFDVETGELQQLQTYIPYSDNSMNGKESVGGLAYDCLHDRIYFYVDGNVWCSDGSSDFVSVGAISNYESTYLLPAWVVNGRYYIIYMYCSIFVFPISDII